MWSRETCCSLRAINNMRFGVNIKRFLCSCMRCNGCLASLAPPCLSLSSFGSKCAALKKVLVTLLGFSGNPPKTRRPGNGSHLPPSLRLCLAPVLYAVKLCHCTINLWCFKEKLCVLVMSMPIYQLLNDGMKDALMFLLHQAFSGPVELFDFWLSARKLDMIGGVKKFGTKSRWPNHFQTFCCLVYFSNYQANWC